jgi:hypothetical protein
MATPTRLAGLTLFASVLTLAGCSSSSHGTATTVAAPVTTVAPAANTLATTPNLPPTPTTGAPSATTAAPACATTEACAQALYAAWMQGDQSAAGLVAAPAAVTKMFSRQYAPIQTNSGPQNPFQFSGCSGAAGSSICTFDGQDQQIQMLVRNSTGGLPIQVTEVKFFEGSPLKEVP